MMYPKAKLFHDVEIAGKIVNTTSPEDVKKLDRLIKGFDSALWNNHRYTIVVNGNYHKFSQDKFLKKYLVDTNDKVLVEASPVDNIWGIGMASNDEHIENSLLWKGENLLGFALMEVRDLLKNGN